MKNRKRTYLFMEVMIYLIIISIILVLINNL